MEESVTIEQLPNWVSLRIRNVGRASLRACYAAALRGRTIIMETIAATTPYPPVDRGSFRASFRAAREPDGASLYSDAPHAAFIEYGCRPHWPPLAPILAWVKRKKLAKGSEAYGVARAIQVAIARRGMAPRKVVARSLDRIEQALHEELDRALVQRSGS